MEAELLWGPQDGAKVRLSPCSDGSYPFSIYLGPKWLGDGYSAYSYCHSKRFPALYWAHTGENGLFTGKFVFLGYKEPPNARPPAG